MTKKKVRGNKKVNDEYSIIINNIPEVDVELISRDIMEMFHKKYGEELWDDMFLIFDFKPDGIKGYYPIWRGKGK